VRRSDLDISLMTLRAVYSSRCLSRRKITAATGICTDFRMPDVLGGWFERARLELHLLAFGKLEAATLERAERLSAESGEQFETVLMRLGLLTEHDRRRGCHPPRTRSNCQTPRTPQGQASAKSASLITNGTPLAPQPPQEAYGAPEVDLIEQMLGEVGERLVEHHDFYSVFETPRQLQSEPAWFRSNN